MKIIQMLAGAAFMTSSLVSPVAGVAQHPKAEIRNLLPSMGTVTVSYMACRPDVFRVGAGRQDSKGLHAAINHAPSRRGLCMITRVHVQLDRGPAVTDFTSSSGSRASVFIVGSRNGTPSVNAMGER
ncbi:MAG: hypothetical protein JWO05_2838 [Gemmatimonadetes bacterium]|nr:hypothetical protein [Gemmatimonadota bacterium]